MMITNDDFTFYINKLTIDKKKLTKMRIDDDDDDDWVIDIIMIMLAYSY